jgi:integrase
MGVKVVRRKGRSGWWIVRRATGKTKWKLIGEGDEARRQADEVATAMRQELAAEALGLPPSMLPVRAEDALRDWYELHWRTLKPSTRETSLGLIRNHLIPAFGNSNLAELKREDLLRFVEQLKRAGKSTSLARNALSLLRRVCSLAIADGRLAKNPCLGVARLVKQIENAEAEEVRAVDAWTPEELGMLLAVTREREPRYFPLILTAAHTGARHGEILALKWSDIDFSRRQIVIRRSISRRESGTPKSGKWRRVPMTAELAQALSVLQKEGRRRRPFDDPDGWVFRSRGGTAIEKTTINRSWRRIRRLAASRGVRPLVFHAFRHTWASLALAAGRSPVWVASVLGHSVEMLLRTYAHATPPAQDPLGFLPSVGHEFRDPDVTMERRKVV